MEELKQIAKQCGFVISSTGYKDFKCNVAHFTNEDLQAFASAIIKAHVAEPKQ